MIINIIASSNRQSHY